MNSMFVFSRKLLFILLFVATFSVGTSLAKEAENNAIDEAQKKMNQEVMDKPFMAAKPEEVDAYIKEAMKNNIKPQEYKGTYWKSGYTCNDLLRHSWTQYRDCKYYYKHYGRYYW